MIKYLALISCALGLCYPSMHLFGENVFSVQSTILTLYKDGGLMKQSRIFPLKVGHERHQVPHFSGRLIPESLMLSLSATPKEATIEEFTLIDEDDGKTQSADIAYTSTVQENNGILTSTYLFKDISWQPYYSIQFAAGYTQLVFNSWFEVSNRSGIHLQNTQLQFVDGRVPTADKNATASQLLQAKGYTYHHPVDLENNVKKRINWSISQPLTTKRDYRICVGGAYLKEMDASNSPNPPIETWVSFYNTEHNGLGKPLPEGSVILYYQDENGHSELLGRAHLNHIDTGQEISFKVPSTQVERTEKSDTNPRAIQTRLEQYQYRHLSDNHIIEANYGLVLENSSDHTITIRVTLDVPDDVTEWDIIRETNVHQTNGNRQVYWCVDVPPKKGDTPGQADLKYQIRLIRDKPLPS
jgi:hypothetical protein